MPEMPDIRRILMPTDGSDNSVRAATYAAVIARCTAAEVVILNVTPVTGVTQFVTYAVGGYKNLSREMTETAEWIIDKTKKPFLEADIPVHSKIREGFPPEMILQEAAAGDYDLIVMGSRGAGAGVIRRTVFGLGSVAQRVVGHAPCPVMVVRE